METMDNKGGTISMEQHSHQFEVLERLRESLDIAMYWVAERNDCEKELKIETTDNVCEIITTKVKDEETHELTEVSLENIDAIRSPLMIIVNTNSTPKRFLRVKEEDQGCADSNSIDDTDQLEFNSTEIVATRCRRSCAQHVSYKEVTNEAEDSDQSTSSDDSDFEDTSDEDDSENDKDAEEMPVLVKFDSVWLNSDGDEMDDEEENDEAPPSPKDNPDNETKQESVWSISEEEEEEEMEKDGEEEPMNPNESSDDEGREKFKCDKCGKYFTTAGTLRVHKLTHLEDVAAKKPYKCDQCDKRYTQAGSLSVHKRSHLAKDDPRLLKFDKIWKCEFCERILSSRTHLTVHRKTHLGDKARKEIERKRPHKCSFCDQRFPVRSALKVHEVLHTGDLPFECELCPLRFAKKIRLERHVANHKKGTAKIRRGLGPKCHRCAICPRRFRRNYELAAHLKRHAEDTVGSSSEDQSDGEVVVEKAEEPVKCELCGNTYFSEQSYKNHKRRVHGGLAFPCTLCKKEYSIKGGLARHMKSEHGVEIEMPPPKVRAPCNFTCKYCPAAFPTEFALGVHLKQHRPASFNCGDCGEKFKKFAALNDQKKSAHGPNPYKCSHCGRRYQEHAQLMEHKKLGKQMIKAGYPEGCAYQKSIVSEQTSSNVGTIGV